MPKLNIHIPLDIDTTRYVRALNKRMSRGGRNEIKFHAPDFHIPHITLYMGYLLDAVAEPKMVATLRCFSERVKPFPIALEAPYYQGGQRGEYVFIPVEPIERIRSLKQQLASAVEQYFKPLPWDVVNAVPHVTVAFFPGSSKRLPLPTGDPRVGPMTWNSIRVAVPGPRGTCLKVIAKCPTQEPRTAREPIPLGSRA